MPSRAKKGTVALTFDRGMVGLRWRYAGERYRLSLGLPDSPLARHKARAIASQIELDMAAGTFDTTRAKYRPALPEPKPAESEDGPDTMALFGAFIDSRRRAGSGEYNLHQVYGTLHRYLERFGRAVTTPDDAAALMASIRAGTLKGQGRPPSERTLNKYLSIYRHFGSWAVANDLLPSDPFRRLEATRTERSRSSRRAFTDAERRAIFAGFEEHPAYRYYLPYVRALFWLGWRPSELIGLRWVNVDTEARSVTVGESLSRDVIGRTRKGTKGGTVRTLSLNDGQWEIIAAQPRNGELVFPAPEGGAIDDGNFCKRVWGTVLRSAGVEYRPPYTARHTFATWAKRQGMSDEALAYWMGHRTTRMVREFYGHLDDAARVPELPEE